MSRSLKLSLSVCGLGGFLLAALPLLAGGAHLPEPLAVHWGIDGAPNGAMSRTGLLVTLALGCALPVVLAWPRQRMGSLRVGAAALPFVVFIVTMMAAVGTSTALLNWDRSDWRAAGNFSPWGLALLVGVPAAAAGLSLLVARRVWPGSFMAEALPKQVLELAEGEQAYWTGTAANRWFVVLGLALGVEGWILALVMSADVPHVPYVVAGLHVFVMVAMMLVVRIRVSVDRRGLGIRYGWLGWPHQRIAMERIVSAAAFDLVPMEHGGWGYRGSLRLLGRAAVVIRGGMALRLDLVGGKRLSVTVDDAENAAQLINGFVSRRSAAE